MYFFQNLLIFKSLVYANIEKTNWPCWAKFYFNGISNDLNCDIYENAPILNCTSSGKLMDLLVLHELDLDMDSDTVSEQNNAHSSPEFPMHMDSDTVSEQNNAYGQCYSQ